MAPPPPPPPHHHLPLEFFKVFLPQRSSHQLQIPPAFEKNLKENLPETFALKTSSSRKTWTVTVKREDEGFFFREGWPKFVKDNDLDFGEFLVFCDEGGSSFTVKTYEKTGCLKDFVGNVCFKSVLDDVIYLEEVDMDSCPASFTP